jgi:hypothetical protein
MLLHDIIVSKIIQLLKLFHVQLFLVERLEEKRFSFLINFHFLCKAAPGYLTAKLSELNSKNKELKE